MGQASDIATPQPLTRSFLLAGGGSGGHISPGLAIAERLIARSDERLLVKTIFICSNRSIDAHMLEDAGVEYVPIPARPPSIKPVGAMRFLKCFRQSKRICRGLIAEREIDHVVALGGFVAAPAVAAARQLGAPVTLINLDDPPGRANRWMARRCDRIWTAIRLSTMPTFAQRVVGLPIRARAMAPADQAHCRSSLGLEPDRNTLLITGASQGAESINTFLTAMIRADSIAFADWQILHLAGHDADGPLREVYASAGVRAHVLDFLDDIGLAWGAADLAVSRAGANSVAEATANAVPTLFLPYPHHRDMHQRNNAHVMVELGGAVIVEDRIDPAANVAQAGDVLRLLLTDEPRRKAMRAALRAHHPPDAADAIARLLLHGRES